MLKLDPDTRSHSTSGGSPLLSEAVGGVHCTVAVGCPEVVFLVIWYGHEPIVGNSSSAMISNIVTSGDYIIIEMFTMSTVFR